MESRPGTVMQPVKVFPPLDSSGSGSDVLVLQESYLPNLPAEV